MVQSQAFSATIAGLARDGDVGVETIRYYQRRGLLPIPESAGVRRYGEPDRQRLRFIRSAQAAGFSLDQIGELLKLDADVDRTHARALAEQQLAILDRRIKELLEARDALARLADDCSRNGPGPCPILRAFG